MKSLLNVQSYPKVMLMLFVCLISLSLEASTVKPQVLLQKHGDKTLILMLDFAQERDFKVSLKDEDRVLLWKENKNEVKHFAKKLNLKKLPDGVYNLEIEDRFMLTIYEVTIKEDRIALETKNPEWVFKPILVQKEEKVLFSLFQKQPSDTEITIYDDESNIVYRERLQDQQKIERSFDFSQAAIAGYVLQTKTNGRLFEQAISW